MATDPNNLIVRLGNLAAYHEGIVGYIADTLGALPVMGNADVDAMMTRVLASDEEEN